MKNLLDPRTPKSIRARNRELNLPMGIPRICTANAMNVEEWCGYRLKWSFPLQRQAVVFQITDYLIAEDWREQHHEGQQDNDEEGDGDVMKVLNENNADRLPPAPQPEPSFVGRVASAAWSFLRSAGAAASTAL